MTPKRRLVLGATGGTGQQLVRQAIEAGHQVTALVRNPDSIPVRHDRLHLVVGTVSDDASALVEAVRACQVP